MTAASTARAPRRVVPAPDPRHPDVAPDLRVVTPRRQRRSWQVGTLAAVVVFVALFAVAGFQTLIVSSQKRLDEIDRGIVAATAEAQQLENQLAELKSPQRITEEAVQRLGMLSPPGVAYLIPGPDDDVRAGEVPDPSSRPVDDVENAAAAETSDASDSAEAGR